MVSSRGLCAVFPEPILSQWVYKGNFFSRIRKRNVCEHTTKVERKKVIKRKPYTVIGIFYSKRKRAYGVYDTILINARRKTILANSNDTASPHSIRTFVSTRTNHQGQSVPILFQKAHWKGKSCYTLGTKHIVTLWNNITGVKTCYRNQFERLFCSFCNIFLVDWIKKPDSIDIQYVRRWSDDKFRSSFHLILQQFTINIVFQRIVNRFSRRLRL